MLDSRWCVVAGSGRVFVRWSTFDRFLQRGSWCQRKRLLTFLGLTSGRNGALEEDRTRVLTLYMDPRNLHKSVEVSEAFLEFEIARVHFLVRSS